MKLGLEDLCFPSTLKQKFNVSFTKIPGLLFGHSAIAILDELEKLAPTSFLLPVKLDFSETIMDSGSKSHIFKTKNFKFSSTVDLLESKEGKPLGEGVAHIFAKVRH